MSRLPEADPNNGYTRTIIVVEYKPLLRSSCNYCGTIITGKATQKVWEEERSHREYCSAPKMPAAASGG